MTIEADIIEALRTNHTSQQAILAEVSKARADTEALRIMIADLEARVARLEAAAVDMVDPAALTPVIEALGRVLKDGYGIVIADAGVIDPSSLEHDVVRNPVRAFRHHASDDDAVAARRRRSSARGWA